MAKMMKMGAASMGAKGGNPFAGKKAPAMPASNMGGGKPFGGKAGKVSGGKGRKGDKC